MVSREIASSDSDRNRGNRRNAASLLSPRCRVQRLFVLVLFIVLWLAVLGWRLTSLQITDSKRWHDWANRQHVKELHLAAERGAIKDRNGNLLAVSVPAGSVYVRPGQVRDRERVTQELSRLLAMPAAAVTAKLDERKPFVWVARQVPRKTAEAIAALKLAGVDFMRESKRSYPYQHAASTLIGKVGVDGVGLSGLERQLNKELQGERTTATVSRDAHGKVIHTVGQELDGELEVAEGATISLTIDADLQLILDEELERGRVAANAKHTLGVLVDAATGEILALGQAPSFNLNNPGAVVDGDSLRNLVAETVIEPGSIMKPIVAAAAIERRVIKATDLLDCEHGNYRVGKHTIRDVHPVDTVSFHDVVVRSSNIGMTKVGMKMGDKALYQALVDFGFGQPTNLGLPGESKGILRPVSRWALVDIATHSFGQGIAVTPLQMARAVSVVANGGMRVPLSLIAGADREPGARVISEKTAETVREMMYGVVEDKEGTGGKAAIEGVRIGGKTGTAQKAKLNGRGYEPGLYVASFAGFVDGKTLGINKTLTLVVMVDEPDTTSIYGGTLAAPIFQRTLQRALFHLSTREELQKKGGA